ncbi:MAG TPA: helix-turn-helix transcriptional regulator [Allosphingosinicella sp.]|nr:helix-turn-helix transcriptional regulator [Allosphingosinicella sp.]
MIGDRGRVALIGGSPDRFVADSFSDFVTRYLRAPDSVLVGNREFDFPGHSIPLLWPSPGEEVMDSMGFGERLKEERRRLGFKQAEFAALAGADVPKQSLYENDRRGLKAPYLSRIAEEGADVLYILTGKRGEAQLDDASTRILAGYLALQPQLQQTVGRLVADLGGTKKGEEQSG